jgi:glutamyl-tRNA synthetase
LSEWSKDGIAKVIEDVAASFEINMGKLGQPIRVAVTSGPVSPPIDVTLWLVGQARTVARLDRALEMIEARAAASGD